MTRRLSVKVAAALVAVPLVLAGCGSGSDSQSGAAATTSASVNAAQGADPFTAEAGSVVDKNAFIEQTTKAVQEKGTYTIKADMSTAGQPMTMNGSVDAKDPANPKMSVKMTLAGQNIDFIIADRMAYMQMPGISGGKYIKMSLQEMMAAGGSTTDLERMLNPQGQLEAQKEAITEVKYVGEETVDGTALRRYTVKVDTAAALKAAGQTALPSAAASAVPATLTYDYYIDSDKLTRKAKISDSSMNIDMTMSNYGEPVTITAPPAGSVTTMPIVPGATATN